MFRSRRGEPILKWTVLSRHLAGTMAGIGCGITRHQRLASKNSDFSFDKTSTDGMMLEDGIGKTSWLDLFIAFKKIIARTNKNASF